MQKSRGQTWNGGNRFQMGGSVTTGPPAGDIPVRDSNGATQRLKATVPDRRVGLPAPACVIVAVRLNNALIKTRKASVRPTSKDCTSGNETRTQNACATVPIRIASYSYTVIVPCTVLYDIPINVAYKTLSKYFDWGGTVFFNAKFASVWIELSSINSPLNWLLAEWLLLRLSIPYHNLLNTYRHNGYSRFEKSNI